MAVGVETPVESASRAPARAAGGPLRLRLLGPLALLRDGRPVALPASRKARGLLAYLALAPGPVARSRLCELLWDAPSDPRGELRWCLSKLRGLLDEPGRRRVQAGDDGVRLDLAGDFVDAIEAVRDAAASPTDADDRPQARLALFGGEFLEGLEIERSAPFQAWVDAQRRRLRGARLALLEQAADRSSGDEALAHLERWIELEPDDARAHQRLLAELARCGRIAQGEAHLARTARRFLAEGLDCTGVREAWRRARAAAAGAAPATLVLADVAPAPADVLAGDAMLAADADADADAAGGVAARRATIAVMPFADRSDDAPAHAPMGDALAHDVVTRLAKLRCVVVIAEATTRALRDRGVDADEAGRTLRADYVASGSLRVRGGRVRASVELVETPSRRIVWADEFDGALDAALTVLDDIGDRIVASVASEIEAHERARAVLRPPSSLDAWGALHLGLWNAYRFERARNERARQCFEAAVRLDPTFSRAWAGLSFAHFQNAFQGWGDREREAERAYEAAGQSLMADDRDPTAHWAMGRALWLRGGADAALLELGRAVELSPNFAQGHYTLAFVHSQSGDPSTAIAASDWSRRLSPCDPMLFGMMGARAMALARLGRFDEAAHWGIEAAARPNAHAQIQAIAALCLALAGRPEQAAAYVAAVRRLCPGYGARDFLSAMRFGPDGERLFGDAARRIGLA